MPNMRKDQKRFIETGLSLLESCAKDGNAPSENTVNLIREMRLAVFGDLKVMEDKREPKKTGRPKTKVEPETEPTNGKASGIAALTGGK